MQGRWPQLDAHVAIAKVVSRPRQIKRGTVLRAWRDPQQRLRRGLNADEGAILGHQHIAAANHRSAREEHADRAALVVDRLKAALLPSVPIQHQAGGAFEQDRGEAVTLG